MKFRTASRCLVSTSMMVATLAAPSRGQGQPIGFTIAIIGQVPNARTAFTFFELGGDQ